MDQVEVAFLGWKVAQGSKQTRGRAESAGAGSQGLTVLTGFLPDFKPSPIPNQWESLSDSTSQTVFFSFHFTVRGGMQAYSQACSYLKRNSRYSISPYKCVQTLEAVQETWEKGLPTDSAHFLLYL